MSDIDSIINNKVCRFYPGDPNNCITDLPMVKIKIVLSIVFIIIGIMTIHNQNNFIERQIIGFFKNFGKLIGFTLIVFGGGLLNKTIDNIIY